MGDFLQGWSNFSGTILGFLPNSPVINSDAIATFSQFAGYINYFIPVGAYLTFLSTLLVVVAVYYAAMVILRWLNIIR